MSKDQLVFQRVGLALVCASLAVAGCSKEADQAASGKESAPVTVAGQVPVDPAKVVVQVNDATLTEGELSKQAGEQYERVASMVPPEQADAYRNQMRVQMAQNFIVTTLLEAEATKRAITVDEADIEKTIADIITRIPEGMTLDKVLEMEGMTQDEFKARLKKDLRVKKMFDQEIVVTDQEIADFYNTQKAAFESPEQVSASLIQVSMDEKDDDAAKAAKKAKIEDLKKQLDAGADFAELAKANSDAPSSKEGGKLPLYTRGDMVDPFPDPAVEAAVFAQATNVVGAVLESETAFQLVKVHEKIPGRVSPLDEVKDKIADYLRMAKSRTIIPPFIDKLRAAATVTIDPDMEKEMAAQRLAEQAEAVSLDMDAEPADGETEPAGGEAEPAAE